MGGTPGALQQTRRADLVTGHEVAPHGTAPGEAELAKAGRRAAVEAGEAFDSAGASLAFALPHAHRQSGTPTPRISLAAELLAFEFIRPH